MLNRESWLDGVSEKEAGRTVMLGKNYTPPYIKTETIVELKLGC
jgi:hypothetical protein